jgi:hypothetical protein
MPKELAVSPSSNSLESRPRYGPPPHSARKGVRITMSQTFGTFVNPIGLDPVNGIGYKFMVVYCCWIAFEAVVIWWLWPETSGRTLEELAFCKILPQQSHSLIWYCAAFLTDNLLVFEDPEKIQVQTAAVESKIQHGDHDRDRSSDEKAPAAAVDEAEHV